MPPPAAHPSTVTADPIAWTPLSPAPQSRRVPGKPVVPLRDRPLTPRELEVIQWTAAGKTGNEIARILGVTYRTIVYHQGNVKSKLRTVTVAQAVAQAIVQGHIQVVDIRHYAPAIYGREGWRVMEAGDILLDGGEFSA